MDYKEFFHLAIHAADEVVKRVQDADQSKATPCSEWNVRALVNHMVYELAWLPDLMNGKTVPEVGTTYDGDLLGDDLMGAWRKSLDIATKTVYETPGDQVVHLSYADVKPAHYAVELGSDLVIHAWDLAKALNVDYHVPASMVETINQHVQKDLEKMRQGKMVGPEVAVTTDVDAETKLLAAYGRSQAWPAV